LPVTCIAGVKRGEGEEASGGMDRVGKQGCPFPFHSPVFLFPYPLPIHTTAMTAMQVFTP